VEEGRKDSAKEARKRGTGAMDDKEKEAKNSGEKSRERKEERKDSVKERRGRTLAVEKEGRREREEKHHHHTRMAR